MTFNVSSYVYKMLEEELIYEDHRSHKYFFTDKGISLIVDRADNYSRDWRHFCTACDSSEWPRPLSSDRVVSVRVWVPRSPDNTAEWHYIFYRINDGSNTQAEIDSFMTMMDLLGISIPEDYVDLDNIVF